VGLLALIVCVVADSCTVVTIGVVLGGAFSVEGVCGGGQLYCSEYCVCVRWGFSAEGVFVCGQLYCSDYGALC